MSKYQNVVFYPYSIFLKGSQSSVIIYWCTVYVPDPILAIKKHISWLYAKTDDIWHGKVKAARGIQRQDGMPLQEGDLVWNSSLMAHWIFLLPTFRSGCTHVSVILLPYASVGITCNGHEDGTQRIHWEFCLQPWWPWFSLHFLTHHIGEVGRQLAPGQVVCARSAFRTDQF